MKFPKNIILFTFAIFANYTDSVYAFWVDDSLKSVNTHFQSSLGLSMLSGRDNAGFNEKIINIDSRSELTRSLATAHKNSEMKIRHELGYAGIADSIWIKSHDLLQINYELRSGTGQAQHCFSMDFETGIFNNYETVTDPANGTSYRELSASVLNPASFETGYGLSVKPNPYYKLGFSLSTAKIQSLPLQNNQISNQGIELARLGRAAIIFNYGFSIQVSYLRELSDQIEISGNGNLFIKGLKEDELEGEASVQVIFKMTKWLQLRMFSKVNHDQSLGQKARYRTEIQTGLYYENNR